MAFIAIKASLTLFWNSSFTAPLSHHRARSVSLVTSVADCVLFSFQGSSPPGAVPLCFIRTVSFDTLRNMYISVSFDSCQYLLIAFSYHLIYNLLKWYA